MHWRKHQRILMRSSLKHNWKQCTAYFQYVHRSYDTDAMRKCGSEEESTELSSDTPEIALEI